MAALFSLTFPVGALCLGNTGPAAIPVPAALLSGAILLLRILRDRPMRDG